MIADGKHLSRNIFLYQGTRSAKGNGRLKRLTTSMLLISTTALTAPAFADTTWTGASSSDWFTSGNWDSGIPNGNHTWLNGATSALIAGQASTISLLSMATTTTGAPTLTISNGGSLTLQSGVVGSDGGSGSIRVTGAGSILTNTSELTFGRNGTGSLTVDNGAHLVSRRLGLSTPSWEGGSGGSATLTVTGAGTVWDNTAGVDVARSAGSTGSLTVSGGATAHILGTGIYTGAGATLTFTGAGTRVEIGDPNDPNSSVTPAWLSPNGGSVTVSDGASLYTSGTYVGSDGGSLATMTVTGSGTSFVGEQRIYVGGQNGSRNVDPVNGNGRLTISNGATAWGGSVGIGMDPNSQGTAVVTGSGSQLWAKANTALTSPTPGNFYVGYAGNALVVVSDGATIKADNQIRIAYNSGSGKLVIGAQEGQAAVAAGTVIAANGIVFGDGVGEIVFNHTNSNLLFDNVIRGNGTIRVLSGTTVLTGDESAFTGQTVVSGGTLKVNGSMAAAVTVADGAILSGSGTIGGVTALSGSTVAPGNSPGTLTVAGNYTQNAGSTYNAELVPGSSVSDKVVVTGSATIAKGATLNLSKYGSSAAYALDAHYTVLSAAGGVSGTYQVTGDTVISGFYSLVAGYDANNVYVDAKQTRAFTSAATTPNQNVTAAALQSLPANNTLRSAVSYSQTDAAARAAFDQLSGEIHASIKGAMVEDSRFVRSAAIDRLRRAFDGVGAPAAPSASYGVDRLTVWSTGYGAWGDVGRDGNAATLSHNLGGFVIGADAPVFDSGRFGILAGYGRATYDVNGRNSSGWSDNYSVGAYGGTQFGALGVRLGTAYTWSDVRTSRAVGFTGFSDKLSGKDNARTFQVFGDAGYRVDVGPVSLEPFAGLAHVNVRTDGFTEQGGAAALAARGSDTRVTFSTIGLHSATDFQVEDYTLTASGSLAWRHAYGNTTPSTSLNFAGSDSFGVAGVPIAKEAALVEAGLSTKLNPDLSLGLSYTGQFANGAHNQGVRGNLSVRF